MPIASGDLRGGAAPFVLPLALFLLLGQAEAVQSLRPWYPLLYGVKLLAVVAALAWGWRAYPPWSGRGMAWAAAYGAGGVVLWVGVSSLDLEEPLRRLLPAMLVGGERVAADPWTEFGRWAGVLVALRVAGMALVVPVMEEVFWRGWLTRYLIDEHFKAVPWGKLTVFSGTAVTLLFTMVHPELLAALLWGAGMLWLYWHSRNLWACVVAHAVTNVLLAAYVLATGSWRLW